MTIVRGCYTAEPATVLKDAATSPGERVAFRASWVDFGFATKIAQLAPLRHLDFRLDGANFLDDLTGTFDVLGLQAAFYQELLEARSQVDFDVLKLDRLLLLFLGFHAHCV